MAPDNDMVCFADLDTGVTRQLSRSELGPRLSELVVSGKRIAVVRIESSLEQDYRILRFFDAEGRCLRTVTGEHVG